MAAATAPAERRRSEGIRRWLISFAECEDFDDAERLARQFAMLAIDRCERLDQPAVSINQMDGFDTRWLAPKELAGS